MITIDEEEGPQPSERGVDLLPGEGLRLEVMEGGSFRVLALEAHPEAELRATIAALRATLKARDLHVRAQTNELIEVQGMLHGVRQRVAVVEKMANEQRGLAKSMAGVADRHKAHVGSLERELEAARERCKGSRWREDKLHSLLGVANHLDAVDAIEAAHASKGFYEEQCAEVSRLRRDYADLLKVLKGKEAREAEQAGAAKERKKAHEDEVARHGQSLAERRAFQLQAEDALDKLTKAEQRIRDLELVVGLFLPAYEAGQHILSKGEVTHCTEYGGGSCVAWAREGACPHVKVEHWLNHPPKEAPDV